MILYLRDIFTGAIRRVYDIIEDFDGGSARVRFLVFYDGAWHLDGCTRYAPVDEPVQLEDPSEEN